CQQHSNWPQLIF
nr:immunoglobulin light chain junction region [Macaca mulatta]